MRVTAAETGGWEDEGAARMVPLGREMDIVELSWSWNGANGEGWGRVGCDA
jgi:hypothetical protein